jgi:hypothetical protein
VWLKPEVAPFFMRWLPHTLGGCIFTPTPATLLAARPIGATPMT